MKFTTRIFKGIYIITQGFAEVENDSGWKGFILNPGDYFGEGLMFKT